MSQRDPNHPPLYCPNDGDQGPNWCNNINSFGQRDPNHPPLYCPNDGEQGPNWCNNMNSLAQECPQGHPEGLSCMIPYVHSDHAWSTESKSLSDGESWHNETENPSGYQAALGDHQVRRKDIAEPGMEPNTHAFANDNVDVDNYAKYQN